MAFLMFAVLQGTPQHTDKTIGQKLLRKVAEARARLESFPIGLETKTTIQKVKTKRGVTRREVKRVVGREIALMGWNPADDSFHPILISIPHPLPKNHIPFVIKNAGYEVTHVTGRIPMKFIFRARNEQPLMVLAQKQWWLPRSAAQEQNFEKFTTVVKKFVYSTFSDEFFIDELRTIGGIFLYDTVERVRQHLIEYGVSSRTFPEELLGNAISTDWIVNVGLNEQMDHGKFLVNPHRTAAEITIEYALNREKAYSLIESNANARGAYQFTNRSIKKRPGTYDRVVKEYKEAKLIPDFTLGTENLENVIAAAFCLLDWELSRLPPEARELYKKDYRTGSIFPTAGYNGGGGRASYLWRWTKKKVQTLSYDTPIPRHAFGRNGGETYVYIQKHQFLWKFVDEIKKEYDQQKLQGAP